MKGGENERWMSQRGAEKGKKEKNRVKIKTHTHQHFNAKMLSRKQREKNENQQCPAAERRAPSPRVEHTVNGSV